MRGKSKVACALGLSSLLGLTAIPSTPTSHAASSPVDALRARRAALVAGLQVLIATRSGAGSDLLAAEQAFADAQSRLLSAQNDLDRTNLSLLALSREIVDDEQVSRTEKEQLAELARSTYEDGASESLITAVLSSEDFQQAVDRIRGATHVSEQLTDLLTTLAQRRADLRAAQTALQADQLQAQRLETTTGNQSNQLVAAVAGRDAALSSADGDVRTLAIQIANLDQDIAGAQTPPSQSLAAPPSAVNGGAPCGNRFYFGQCTWYVANRRCIPWLGNANQWFANAAAMGYAEGHTPRPGAVVAFRPGGDGAGGIGHVGYVEQVGPGGGVPRGKFSFSEMNFSGWDRLTRPLRILPDNSGGIQGFIYGKA